MPPIENSVSPTSTKSTLAGSDSSDTGKYA